MGEDDDFEWDDSKELINVLKHGLSLTIAARLFADQRFVEMPSSQKGTDVQRYVAIGLVYEDVVICVYTWRGKRRRVISLRYASRSERRAFERTLKSRGSGH
jgi:uncharacterized protein